MTVSPAQKYRPLLLAGLALIALPFAMRLLGLSLNTGTMVVILAIATMALNLCVGYTGLVSFGHSTWFGIGAYAAGLIQLHWFGGEIWLPLLLSMAVVAVLSAIVGVIILRRRGVYFSLLTLAFAALTYTIAFRWSEVTGGEDGLGGLKRGSIGPFSLDNALAYYIIVALIGLAVLYVLLRLVRSPFGHVLVAIRENQLRATFQGYPVERYKLGGFRDLGRGDRACRRAARVSDLSGFGRSGLGAVLRRVAGDGRDRRHAQHAGAGARRAVLHPVPRTVFDLDAELAALVRTDLRRLRAVFARTAWSASGARSIRRWRPAPEEAAAMSKRRIYEGLPLPAFLRPQASQGTVLEVEGISKHFGGIRAVSGASLHIERRRDPRPDRPERRRQDHAVQPGLGPVPARSAEPFASTAARFRACRPT